MPTSATQHPGPEQLSAFGLGRLTEEESRQVELHLADCDECRRQVEELPGDALVSLLQASAQETSSNATPASSTAEVNAPAKAESQPPLYKKLASILTGKEEASAEAKPAAQPRAPGFAPPRELEGHARYDVLAPLGAGGMGTVYKAQHRLMGRLVALKIVNPLLVTRPGAVERFEREVKAAAQLVHPNIVTAFDAEKVGDMHVLVMEYVEGETLAQAMLGRRELPVATACDYVRQTAVGLAHALERGMVHRDIKPQNLMLTGKGVVKILDFGLARFVSEQGPSGASTEQGALMGSPDYMAPEQAEDAHAADARADIYGMGCTLYHLLAGQVPFPGTALLQKLEAHRDKPAIALHLIRPDVPIELSNVIAKMMAKNPADRYQTPMEVAEALTPFAKGLMADRVAPRTEAAVARRFSGGLVFGTVISAALLLTALGYWLAQVVFRVETPDGTLIVKTDDPGVQISVRSGGKEVDLIFTKQKKQVPLKIGKYSLEVVKGIEGMKLNMNSFEITNDQKKVTVEFVPAKPMAATDNEPPAPLGFPFTAEVGQRRQKEWADHLKRKVVEENSIGMKLALIPPGEFPMTPECRVKLSKPIYMGAHAVTVGQFRQFMKENTYRTSAENSGGGLLDVQDKPKPEHKWDNKNYSPSEQHPVVFVSWTDANQFCAWLSLKEKKTYRLPTNAEWDWASRAGTNHDVESMQKLGWFAKKAGKKSQPVGKLPPNTWGLFDVFGNVHELVHDRNGPLPAGLVVDPKGPAEGDTRLLRAGSFLVEPADLEWHHFFEDGAFVYGGFRVVCEVEQPSSESLLANIPSVEELLKTRVVVKVAQDGSERHKTIREALDDVRAGGVVQVMGKGPYREMLDKELPSDVALVSLDGARIEVERTRPEGNWRVGAMLIPKGIFRMSGLRWVSLWESDLPFTLLSLPGSADVIVEKCTFEGKFPGFSFALECSSDSDRPRMLLIQENYFGGCIATSYKHGDVTIQKNWFAKETHRSELYTRLSGRINFRHNILEHVEGPVILGHGADKGKTDPGADVRIRNNVILVDKTPLGFWEDLENVAVLPRSAVVANNIFRSQAQQGVLALRDTMKKVKDRYEIGPNTYGDKPKSGELWDTKEFGIVWPAGPNDPIEAKPFLSTDKNDRNYLRIAAGSPLAKDGSGGDYFGAFPPGPAPKEGDWFTQLQERVKRPPPPPLVAKATFAWPAEALREGRIPMPDLGNRKPVYKAEFKAPVPGWEKGDDEYSVRGYANGKYFIECKKGEEECSFLPNTHAAFVYETEGRVTGADSNYWMVSIENQQRNIVIALRVTVDGRLIVPFGNSNKGWRDPPLYSGTHTAIKEGKEFNKLTTILRNRCLEIYVNGVAVCNPLYLDFDLEPATLMVAVSGKAKTRAEFERITVWSAEGLPTPEERLKSGSVPAK